MTQIEKIRKLNFGAPAAERDIHQGLKGYFFESESYRRLQEGSKSVILGNRGSGKSAIFKMLAEERKSKGHIIIELAPEDYSYEILNQALVREKEGSWVKHGAYAAAWKFLIFVTTMKKIGDTDSAWLKRSCPKIFNYLRDNYANVNVSKLDTLISYLKRIEGVKIGQYEAALKTKELQKLYKLEEINEMLVELKTACDKHPVSIFVDELDQGWDSSEDAKAFVAGLFQAALSVNQLTSSLKIYISLRKELYDNIPALYEDSQKVWDLFEVIEWDEENLLKMITKRIEHSLPDLKERKEIDKWSDVFSETLEYRQTKSFNYVVDRSLYRPREIIQFCTEIREKALTSQSFPFDYATVSQAEYKYSESRTKDIAAEYRFQYPGLLSVFESFRGMSYNFERDDLEYQCLKLITGEIRVPVEAVWIKNQEPELLINILWSVGFIRAQAVGGIKARRRSGSEYLGSHQISNLNLVNIAKFHVHPMFRVYLGLKESKT